MEGVSWSVEATVGVEEVVDGGRGTFGFCIGIINEKGFAIVGYGKGLSLGIFGFLYAWSGKGKDGKTMLICRCGGISTGECCANTGLPCLCVGNEIGYRIFRNAGGNEVGDEEAHCGRGLFKVLKGRCWKVKG